MNLNLTRNALTLAALVAVTALVVGCGSDSKTSSSTDSAATLSAASAEAKLAEATVSDYYTAIGAKNLKEAWSKLSKKARDHFYGYENWALGKRGIKTVKVTSTQARVVTGKEATVDVTYKLIGIDACKKKINQTFSGSWTLDRVGGEWIGDKLTIKQTGGGKPQTNRSKCPGATSQGTSTTASGQQTGSGSKAGSSGGSSGGGSDESYQDDCEYYGDCYDDYGDDEYYPEDTTPVPPVEQDDGANTNAQNFQP